MTVTIQIGDIVIALTRKDIKHVHLSVHPPLGRVSLVAPTGTRLEVARAYAISKLGWIRAQRAKLEGQARETPRRFIERESHYLWGRRYLLSVVERDEKPSVRLSHREITLCVRPGSRKVGGGARLAQGLAARTRASVDQEVGGEAPRHRVRLFHPAHEDEVGWM
jgi:predicted metal-dependent hydrolase